MKINTSRKYALMVAGYIASHRKDGNIIGRTIAKEYDIPFEYLLKILQQLCNADILQSKRGIHGGFVLSRDPSEITLLQIMQAIEGSASDATDFAKQTGNARFALRMKEICEKATVEQNRILSEATLADMIKHIGKTHDK